MAEGNTPSGNPGAGTVETSSSPTTATPARATIGTVNDGAMGAAVDAPITDGLTDADFKQDGNLRKASVDKINEASTGRRGGERSFNEVTGETTVTTTFGGQTVTFVEDGDTREPREPSATDSAIRAMDNANEAEDK